MDRAHVESQAVDIYISKWILVLPSPICTGNCAKQYGGYDNRQGGQLHQTPQRAERGLHPALTEVQGDHPAGESNYHHR